MCSSDLSISATVMSEIEACSNPVAREKAGKKVFSPEQLNLKAAFLSAISESGVRDESGKEHAIRLVIEPASSRQGQDDLVRLLLAHTSLETNAAINLTGDFEIGRASCRERVLDHV